MIYFRFIDDIFIATLKEFNINNLTSNFDYLTLNVVSSDVVNFLDLDIKLCKYTNRLNFSVYIKPTNTFSYLDTSSNHPKFIFKNIPKTLFIRIRRICSDLSDYLFYARKLFSQLVIRGYDPNYLTKIIRIIAALDRSDIIKYKLKVNKFSNSNILFINEFDVNNHELNKSIKNSFLLNFKDHKLFKDFQFNLINSVKPNISSILVHNFKVFKKTKFFFKKCKDVKCTVCPYASDQSFHFLGDFPLPVMCNSNCKSVGAIYVLMCLKCNYFYIGETIDFQRRLKTHLRSMKNGLPVSVVEAHFHNDAHVPSRDFRFFIFKNNILKERERWDLENHLIYLFEQLNMNLLNDKRHDIFKYKINSNLFSLTSN